MNTETVTTSAIDFKDALKLLDKLANEQTFKCFVPSVQKELTFKEVTTGQQKELLKSIVDSPFYKSKFITTTYKILKDNFVDDTIKFDDLTIIDKQLILLKMRIECFDSKYELDTPPANVDPILDLNEVYNTAVKITNEPITLKDKIDFKDISICVCVPDVNIEYQLEKELHENIEIANINNTAALRTTLGDIFISEIAKYVTLISFGGEEINLRALPFRLRIQILEKVPVTALRKVIEFIDLTKEKINSITTVKLQTKDKETKTASFTIDGAFFTAK